MNWEGQKSNWVQFIIFHTAKDPRSHSCTRFVATIADNLQYNLVCSLLKWSDNISLDHEWGSSGGESLVRGVWGWGYEEKEEEGGGEGNGAKGEVGKETERGCCNSFLLWKSYGAGVYDQLPDCTRFTNPTSHTCTHAYLTTHSKHSVIWRNKYQQCKRSDAEVNRRGRSVS